MKRVCSVTSVAIVASALAALTSTIELTASAASITHVQNHQGRTLTFADRVAYQYAIEEVYWRHRIWPKGNNRPKPTLDEAMSAEQVQKKVEDYLRDSQALENYWQRPITAKQLQAEMERMASHTKQPEVLREVFGTLANDPFLIAECLARPILAERMLAERETELSARIGQSGSDLDSKSNHKAIKNSWPSAVVGITRRAADLPETMSIKTTLDAAGYKLPEISVPNACTDDTWAATKSPPEGRRQHTAVWTGSEMIVWGGEFFDPDVHYLNTGGRYNPSTDSWTATSTTGVPVARYAHTAIWTGNEMIVWGGYDGSNVLNTGARYNPSTNSWTATSTTSAPDGRELHTAVWTGSQMIIWGGAGSSYFNTGGKYNPSSDSWTATSIISAPDGRDSHTAVWTGSEMIVWGGESATVNFNTGGKYNPIADNWTAINTTNAPAGRYLHTAVWTGNEMVAWGGTNDVSFLSTGGRYNPSTNSWTATSATNAPAGRIYHTAVWTGSEMIVWGGTSGPVFDTGGRYNPNTNSWTATGTTGAPSARASHTAVWSGNEMIVWGGQGNTGIVNTGGRYNPSTDGWIATTNTPDARSSHTAVWTGTEMIVWGGYYNSPGGSSGYFNTGGRYTPSTDTWTPTSITNAPTGRNLHTAVWSGTEMIVWGGYFYDGTNHYLNTGGRYNPSTDTWTTTSLTSAPAGREYHTAVWTGSDMIVWGGGGPSYFNTGGRYNPSTDNWIATNTTSAPMTRVFHTAIWTGNQMTVWGGYNDVGYLNTGGKYNPSTDSWTVTSTTNAPDARYDQTAVWTGSEMIVWGGYTGGSNVVNTGGRYNPSTDSWTATSTTNAPQARRSHTAVWTGSEMIVWGGEFLNPDFHYLNTGGRYNSSTDSWTATSTTAAPVARGYHTAVWTGNEMIIWGGLNDFNFSYFGTGGTYCAQPSTPIVQSAVSRKSHGSAGSFDVNLPLSGTPGIECRSGTATNDYIIAVTFLANVSISGNPQAAVTSGTGIVGSGGVSNGGMVTIAGNVVTIPLTNVSNAQTISVTLNGVDGSTNVVIPIRVLIGDVNGNASVNASDVGLAKLRLGQAVSATNFRSDVNANGSINASDVSIVKSKVGTGLP